MPINKIIDSLSFRALSQIGWRRNIQLTLLSTSLGYKNSIFKEKMKTTRKNIIIVVGINKQNLDFFCGKETYCCFYIATPRIDPGADFPMCNPNVRLFAYQLIRHT